MSDYGAPPPPSYGGMPPAQPPATEPPSNYLVWAILATIFCCLPLGIVAIVFSAQVNSKWNAGDYTGAQESSAKAKQWTIITAVAGVIFTVLYIIGIFALGMALPGAETNGM